MGNVWVHQLPDICANAGLRWRTWPGWETRSRSTGGYDRLLAVGVHHTASNASPDSDCSYMWGGSPDEPIGAVLLDRTGLVTIGAAGATNTQGKGGPSNCSGGTIPLDSGNKFMFSIEAANGGTGEPWPQAQQDGYVTLVAALCDAFGFAVHSDCLAHFEWTDRKIDPAGNSRYANGGNQWNMDLFRQDVINQGPQVPIPTPPPEDEDVTILLLQANAGSDFQKAAVFWWDGRHIGWIRTGVQQDVGTFTGMYIGQPPLNNFDAGQIQGMIDSGWFGGPIPPGYAPPASVDSSVT